MTNSPRGDEPTQWLGNGYSGYSGYPGGYPDPAYAAQPPYAPPPTQRLPIEPAYGYDPYGRDPHTPTFATPPESPPPGGPKPPRWLWIVAGIAVIAVIGLVIALVIVNSSQQETVLAPVPSLSPSTSTKPSTTSSRPSTTPRPVTPSVTTTPATPSPSPGVTQTVLYTVSGPGRAINITYVDNGGVLQTEFNVVLPWSKQVDLAAPADRSASVSIINVGRQVSCSITVGGVQVQQHSGAGLTICSPVR